MPILVKRIACTEDKEHLESREKDHPRKTFSSSRQEKKKNEIMKSFPNFVDFALFFRMWACFT